MDRDSWSTYHNFVDMYENVYAGMEAVHVAEKLNEPRWLDENGEEVLDQQSAFGCKATHHMVFPSNCMFVDEVGCNTDQEGDSHIGGELKIAE